MSDTELLRGLRRLLVRDRVHSQLNLPELDSTGRVQGIDLPPVPVFRCRRDRDHQRPPYFRVP